MHRGHRGSLGFVAVLALVIGACGANTPGSTQAPASIGVDATASAAASWPVVEDQTSTSPEPASSPTPGPSATSDATPTPSPTPKPTPVPLAAVPTSAAGWTAPRTLVDSFGCEAVTAAIDTAGHDHIAATCGGSIRYYSSKDGSSWSTRVFVHPVNRTELAPQIAVSGNVLYVAYYRLAPDGGCGSLGTDVGVYYRSRTLPNGAWSVARKIGVVADTLPSFAVAGGSLFATVENNDKLYYETLHGTTFKRTSIPGAYGRSSLAVGSDGRARVAYESSAGLRFGVYSGSSLVSSKVGGSTGRDWAPRLALDAGDQPHLLWTRSPAPGGCAIGGPQRNDGIYYGTKASGSWVAHRLTAVEGETAFDMNDATGRLYALVNNDSGPRPLRRRRVVPQTGVQVVSAASWTSSPTIRVDPATGRLLIAFVDYPQNGRSRIYVVTKP